MTREAREQAIDDIQRHLDFYPKAGLPSRESLQMAVQALEKLEKIQSICEEWYKQDGESCIKSLIKVVEELDND